MNCNHNYIDARDGTGDKYCPRCGNRATQGTMHFKSEPDIVVNINISDKVNNQDIKRIAEQINRHMKLSRCMR